MVRILPSALTNMRQLLLALLVFGLILRMGGGCEAMAATATMPVAHQSHCADIPARPDKPVKSDIAACALCTSLPDAAVARVGEAPAVTIEPIAGTSDTLAGLAVGPAPPPPKIA